MVPLLLFVQVGGNSAWLCMAPESRVSKRLALGLTIESSRSGRRATSQAKVAELVDALDLGSSG